VSQSPERAPQPAGSQAPCGLSSGAQDSTAGLDPHCASLHCVPSLRRCVPFLGSTCAGSFFGSRFFQIHTVSLPSLQYFEPGHPTGQLLPSLVYCHHSARASAPSNLSLCPSPAILRCRSLVLFPLPATPNVTPSRPLPIACRSRYPSPSSSSGSTPSSSPQPGPTTSAAATPPTSSRRPALRVCQVPGDHGHVPHGCVDGPRARPLGRPATPSALGLPRSSGAPSVSCSPHPSSPSLTPYVTPASQPHRVHSSSSSCSSYCYYYYYLLPRPTTTAAAAAALSHCPHWWYSPSGTW